MKPGLPLTRCIVCTAGYYPPRFICPNCGSALWRDDVVNEGVVEQSTVVRHATGNAEWKPRHIATVRTSEGQIVVAGLEEPLPNATRVALFDQEGSPIARKL